MRLPSIRAFKLVRNKHAKLTLSDRVILLPAGFQKLQLVGVLPAPSLTPPQNHTFQHLSEGTNHASAVLGIQQSPPPFKTMTKTNLNLPLPPPPPPFPTPPNLNFTACPKASIVPQLYCACNHPPTPPHRPQTTMETLPPPLPPHPTLPTLRPTSPSRPARRH